MRIIEVAQGRQAIVRPQAHSVAGGSQQCFEISGIAAEGVCDHAAVLDARVVQSTQTVITHQIHWFWRPGWQNNMTYQSVKARRVAISGVAAMMAIMLGSVAAEAADTSWPTSVAAKYKLSFGGFEVGTYRFQSTSNGKTYETTGSADVSALFGAFKWKGGIESRGTLGPNAPAPTGYKLSFKSKSKAGSVTLGFDKIGVKSVELEPPKPPHPDAVPVKAEHLKSVLDPMSSILAMTHGTGDDPCDRTIPIFDGKVRFNLVMSAKGEQRIKEEQPSGQPKALKVCKVKYVPLAGHKPKDFAKPWVDYDSMEISLRPIPSANVYVPYTVTIPTTLGAAVMSAESINITSSDQKQIALTH